MPLSGDGSSAQASTRAARDDGQAVSGGDLHALGDLLGGVGKDDEGREVAVDGAVVLEDYEVFGPVYDVVVADDCLELLDYGVDVHCMGPPCGR